MKGICCGVEGVLVANGTRKSGALYDWGQGILCARCSSVKEVGIDIADGIEAFVSLLKTNEEEALEELEVYKKLNPVFAVVAETLYALWKTDHSQPPMIQPNQHEKILQAIENRPNRPFWAVRKNPGKSTNKPIGKPQKSNLLRLVK